MGVVGNILRAYEDEVILPLVQSTGIDPIRGNTEFVMTPGSVVFLMNNAEDFSNNDKRIYWQPLTVLYSDQKGRTGTVYEMKASLDRGSDNIRMEFASITGIVDIVRHEDYVAWFDPLSAREFIRYPMRDEDKVFMNSWYLFNGAVLPMIRKEVYRFVNDDQKFAFQQTMIRHISTPYRGLVNP